MRTKAESLSSMDAMIKGFIEGKRDAVQALIDSDIRAGDTEKAHRMTNMLRMASEPRKSSPELGMILEYAILTLILEMNDFMAKTGREVESDFDGWVH